MAAGMRKFRVLILLLAFCSAVYIAIGPMALNYWNEQETRNEADGERDGQVTSAEHVRISFVDKVFNTSEQVLQLTQRKPYPIQQLPVPVPDRPRINLNVQPAISNETVIEDDNDRVNDGLIYDCFDDERDTVESKQSVNGKPVYGKNRTVMFVRMPKCYDRSTILESK
ncbi:uncharacterized protein LOC115920008 [Strongylocentrotus purpuratus]|uniref:Uncharacterized protein n=1 Tax=Strongylocentrotus purpuratus TaxID=7668 RepID=A0A7M7N571_STRPU|nr:uncharacterized protein LOC115920008 [Strongylocentrotus purpuratus]